MPHVHSSSARAARLARAVRRGFVVSRDRKAPFWIDFPPPCPPPAHDPPPESHDGKEKAMRANAKEFSPILQQTNDGVHQLLASANQLIESQNATIAHLRHCLDDLQNKTVEKIVGAPIQIQIEEKIEEAKQVWKAEVEAWVKQAQQAMRETLDAKDKQIEQLRTIVENQPCVDETISQPGVGDIAQPGVDQTTQPRGDVPDDVTTQPRVDETAHVTTQPGVDETTRPAGVQCISTRQHRMKIYSFRSAESANFTHIARLGPRLPSEWHQLFRQRMPMIARCVYCIQSLNPDADAWQCNKCNGLLHAETSWLCKDRHDCSNDGDNGGSHLSQP